MFYRLRRQIARAAFDWRARGIRVTQPLVLRDAPLAVVSMVRSADLAMYLLAIKSFYRHLPGGQVVVLDDGTLSAEDRAKLAEHIPGVRIDRLNDVAVGPCPRGGCWERLLYILDLSAERFVIQLDSDVLTSGPIPEIVDAVARNASFTLNSGPDFRIVSVEAAAAAVEGHDMRYPQVRSEAVMPGIPPALGRRYVRGSAGFAGFGRGAVTRGQAEAYSAAMQGLMGEQWRAWGTEQVTSNFLVANAPGGHVLPWPAYACHGEDCDGTGARLLHFIGSWRFERGVYAGRARQVIRDLAA
jgi:hypothetical protein